MSLNKVFVGFDCHKETHYCVVIDLEATKIKSFELTNDPKGISQCIQQLLKLREKYEMFIGVEGSKNYGKSLSKALLANDFKVFEVCSSLTKSRRGRVTGTGKSDERDADIVARIVRDEKEKLPPVIFKVETEVLIKLTTRRNDLVKMRTQELNRLHASLLELDPDYKSKGNITTSKRARIYWLRYCTQGLAKDGIFPLEQAQLFNIKSIIEMIEHLTVSLLEIKKKIVTSETESTKLLCSINGISHVIAAEIMANISSIEQFKNADHLASYCGLAPVTFSSGKGSTTRVNLKGNRRLNTLLDRVALTALLHNELSKMYYEKKVKEGKTKKQARRYLARRLIKIIYAILSKKKPYDANHKPLLKKIAQIKQNLGRINNGGNEISKVA